MVFLCDSSGDSESGFHLPSEPIGQRVFSFVALIRDSSAVERLPVKQRDVCSNRTLGANLSVIPGSFNCEDRTL